MSMIFVAFRFDYPFLRESLLNAPRMEIEWIRDVMSEGQREMLFWARWGDFEAFDAGIENDPTVTLLDAHDIGKQRIYRVGLEGQGEKTGPGLYPLLIDTASFVQRATATTDGWFCRIGSPDKSTLDQFFCACRERDIEYDIERVVERRDIETETFGLTGAQREALVTAFECGYFAVPRDCTLEELGDRLDISDTAVSMRLRRGIQTLLERTVSLDLDADRETKAGGRRSQQREDG